ncbi:MAG: sulfatase, partial [Verrucomicrobiota bacterium]
GEERPNVLFIAIDDLNDWVGPLGGHPQVVTPHLDRLARRGVTFTNAHCQSPLCNPSRTSVMTGLRPTTTGVYSLQPWFRSVDSLQDHVTLPQYFAKHGYRTLSGGKIYHGSYGRNSDSVEFHDLGPGASGKPFPPEKLVDTPQPHKLVDWGMFDHRDEDKGDWLIADWAVSELDRQPEGPFFLACGFFLPHVPCYATPEWFDLYPKQTTALPPILTGDRGDTPRFSWYLHWKLPEPRLKFLVEEGEVLNLTRSYLATISFVDSQVGRVLDALDRNGLRENTVIVLWSDHGWHLGEKEITGKNTLWDPSTKVPLLFAGPGILEGVKCAKPAELLDLYPTLLEACGLPANAENEGLSLMPQLRNPNALRLRPALTTHGPGNDGLRTETWRYIRYADGSEELYDMKKDPEEWTNLAATPEYDSVKQELEPFFPRGAASPAPGSRSRLLEIREDGEVYWERKKVGAEDPIPEI